MPECLSCGADMPEGFTFCGRCGAPLSSAPDLEERRVVTVLFCDLAGFTARSDRADPEDVRALLRPYHARLRHEIERFGGTLDKFIGDGVMAVFGAPVAHEDDPERAVRCGLAIQQAVADLNQAQAGLGLRVRVGINTSEAVIAADRHQSETVVGDVVNTASRLEGVAPVGGVVVGEPTFKATREVFDYQALAPVRVKGKAEPLPIWRVIRARSRLGVVSNQGPATPFLGRATELEQLQAIYTRTRDEAPSAGLRPAARGPARPPASRCYWSGADRAAAGPPRWAAADVGDRAASRRVGWSGGALVGLERSAGTSMGPPYRRCRASGTTTLFAELWLGKAHHALAIRRSVVAAGGLGSKLCLRMKIDGRPPVILTTVEADVSPPP